MPALPRRVPADTRPGETSTDPYHERSVELGGRGMKAICPECAAYVEDAIDASNDQVIYLDQTADYQRNNVQIVGQEVDGYGRLRVRVHSTGTRIPGGSAWRVHECSKAAER